MPARDPIKVTLDYQAPLFGPTPRKILVRPNDTVEFRIGAQTLAAQPGCLLRITLHRSQHFSPGVLQHSVGGDNTQPLILSVTPNAAVAAAAPARPHLSFGYKCELLNANGDPLGGNFSRDGAGAGGEIEPDTGFASNFGT